MGQRPRLETDTRVLGELIEGRPGMRLVDDYEATTNDRWQPTTHRATTAAESPDATSCPRTRSAQQSTSTRPEPLPHPIGDPPTGGRSVREHRQIRPRSGPRGAIRDRDVVVRAFARIGWGWGGHCPLPRDYQHFTALTPGTVDRRYRIRAHPAGHR